MALWKAKYFRRKLPSELGKHSKQDVDQKKFAAFAIHSPNAPEGMDVTLCPCRRHQNMPRL
jgi:hypothetical protein